MSLRNHLRIQQAGNVLTQIHSCVPAIRRLRQLPNDSITGGGVAFRYLSAAQQQRGEHDVGLHANCQAQLSICTQQTALNTT